MLFTMAQSCSLIANQCNKLLLLHSGYCVYFGEVSVQYFKQHIELQVPEGHGNVEFFAAALRLAKKQQRLLQDGHSAVSIVLDVVQARALTGSPAPADGEEKKQEFQTPQRNLSTALPDRTPYSGGPRRFLLLDDGAASANQHNRRVSAVVHLHHQPASLVEMVSMPRGADHPLSPKAVALGATRSNLQPPSPHSTASTGSGITLTPAHRVPAIAGVATEGGPTLSLSPKSQIKTQLQLQHEPSGHERSYPSPPTALQPSFFPQHLPLAKSPSRSRSGIRYPSVVIESASTTQHLTIPVATAASNTAASPESKDDSSSEPEADGFIFDPSLPLGLKMTPENWQRRRH